MSERLTNKGDTNFTKSQGKSFNISIKLESSSTSIDVPVLASDQFDEKPQNINSNENVSSSRPWYKPPPEYEQWSDWEKFCWRREVDDEIIRRGMYRP